MAIQRPQSRTTPSPATDTSTNTQVRNRPAPRNGVPMKSTFQRANLPVTQRMIVALSGEEKSGKDHTALTGPSPIYLHSFDVGVDGVVQKFQKKKEIWIAPYELEIQPGEASANEVATSADKVWQQFVSNYKDSLPSAKNGTVIVDTSSEGWELLRLARFGKLTQIMPHMYGSVNAEFRDLIREAYNHKANVFFLEKRVDEWENYLDSTGKEKGRKTGNKVRKGFGDLPFLVQVNAICYREDIDGGGSEFKVLIEDCRQSPSCNGLIMPNDYESLAMAVFADKV